MTLNSIRWWLPSSGVLYPFIATTPSFTVWIPSMGQIDLWIELPLARDIQKHWTAVSTLLGLISSVYCDLPHLRSNQQTQNAEPKLYHWAINPHCTQVTPNQLVTCDVDWWLSGRVYALHSVVTGLISSGRDHGIYTWWDLIRSKQQSSVSVCHAQVFGGFSGRDDSIHNIIPLLKKENIHQIDLFENYSDSVRPCANKEKQKKITSLRNVNMNVIPQTIGMK